jgi:hypothetical protein
MEARGLAPDKWTRRVLSLGEEDVSRMRSSLLKRLLVRASPAHPGSQPDDSRGDGSRYASRCAERASALFSSWLGKGEANARHLAIMMASGDASSAEQSVLLERAEGVGLVADAAIYNAMLYTLLLEARPTAEAEALLGRMQAAGFVSTNRHTRATLTKSSASWQRIRNARLTRCAGGDQAASPLCPRPEHRLPSQPVPPAQHAPCASCRWLRLGDARSHALAASLFDGLLARGGLNGRALAIALSWGGAAIAESAEGLLERAERAGVVLDTSVLNGLLGRLQIEGRSETELNDAVERMRARGVEPDEHTWRALERSAAELDRMRTSTLKRWLESDAGPAHEAAWQLFEMLLLRGAADATQLACMIAYGHTPIAECEVLLERAEREGIVLDASVLNGLLGRLQIEGRPETELSAAVERMRARGVEPDEHTRQLGERSATALADIRRTLIRRWRRGGSARSRAAARVLMETRVAQADGGGKSGPLHGPLPAGTS